MICWKRGRLRTGLGHWHGPHRDAAQAQEVHAFIRGLLAQMFDATVAAKVRIQYGGSVKLRTPRNYLVKRMWMALVGGASLDAKGFAQIIRAVV